MIRKYLLSRLLIIFFFLLFSNFLFAQDSTTVQKFIKKTDISGQWFLAYNYNIIDNFNQFRLKRGYFTVKTQLNSNISVRYTQDITLDKDGNDAGNVEMRLKYLYMKFKCNKNTIFRNSYLEFGLVHRPFIDFEQKINGYRVQDKMFSEIYHIYSSADFGFTIGGNIGAKLNPDAIKKVGKSYAGKYGSYAFGLYNGAGYHAIEYNNNKTFEGRLSLRPFPYYIPGLQFTYVGAYGTSNLTDTNINYNANLIYVSFKNKKLTLTGQYVFCIGNFDGSYINDLYQPLKNDGFSVFSELFFYKDKLSLIGKYDNFQVYSNPMSARKNAIIGGVSFHFLDSKLLLFYGNNYENNFINSNQIAELVLEIVF